MTRGRRWALSRVLLVLGAAGIASSAAAQSFFSGIPAWAVEAPDAADSRFAVGLITFGERQESLRIAAFDQLVEVEDLRTGRVETSRLPGDPALLDRKFDLRFEEKGVGSSFAVALPTPSIFGADRVYSTLALHAAEADVSLDFHDVTNGQDSTSLRGSGPLFATELEVVTTLCTACSWFAVNGVRFEKLPSLTVDRSPRFGLQGFTLSRDDVRLEREVREIASRVGYAAPGGRTASFVGVKHRWTDIDLEDRLAFRDAVAETRLSAGTKLESETTLAVAGIDVALGRRLFGRLDTAIGGGDTVLRLNLAYLPAKADEGGEGRDVPPPWIEPRSINLTLSKLAWPLAAALETTRTDLPDPLLAARGELLEPLLAAHGIRLDDLARETSAADGVRPRVILADGNVELDLEARLRDAGIDPERLSSTVPPIVTYGLRATLIIVFVDASEVAARRLGPRAGFVLVRWEEAARAVVRWSKPIYRVEPLQWTPLVRVTHAVCTNRDRATEIRTKLQYGGGRTDTGKEDKLANWQECDLPGGAGLSRHDVVQWTAIKAREPIILAGAYVLDESSTPSILVNRILRVGKR